MVESRYMSTNAQKDLTPVVPRKYRSIFFMLHDLYLHKFAQAEKGRKLHIADDNIMRSAENLVNSEFAHVLGLEPADVVPFILREAFPEK